MDNRIRLFVIGLTTAVILVLVNVQIVGKERIVREGTTMLLRLAPIDPRSLLQGDYMALRYAMTGEIAAALQDIDIRDGRAIVEPDAGGEAHFVGIDEGQPLADGQRFLQFRRRGDVVRLGSDAFFFEEGEGERYRDARYGELRVARDGRAVLINLRDARKEPL